MINIPAVQEDQPPESKEGEDPLINITGLRFTWPKNTAPTLDIDHFQVEKGELLFVMGPSGSGKSTLLGILTGILLPQQGDVKVLHQKIGQLGGSGRDRFRADYIGYIFQMFNLIPYLSVVENVLLPCQFSASRKKNALKNSQSLTDEALRLLKHLNLTGENLLKKPVVELSVGQQQRVAAARALIGSPKLIIADEPTSSLDVEHREAFLRLIFDECQKTGSTMIFVSHDTGLSSLFDRVVELSRINRAEHGAGEFFS